MKRTWKEREPQPTVSKSKKQWRDRSERDEELRRRQQQKQEEEQRKQEEQPERKEPAVSPRVEKPGDRRGVTDARTGGNAPRQQRAEQPAERRTGEERAERQVPYAPKEPKPEKPKPYSPVDALVESAAPKPEAAMPTMPPAVKPEPASQPEPEKPKSGWEAFADDEEADEGIEFPDENEPFPTDHSPLPNEEMGRVETQQELAEQYNALLEQRKQLYTLIYGTGLEGHDFDSSAYDRLEQLDTQLKTIKDQMEGRGGNIFSGALMQTLAGFTDAERTMYEAGQGMRDTMTAESLADAQHTLERAQADFEAAQEMYAAGEIDEAELSSWERQRDEAQRMVDAFSGVGEAQRGATEETANIADVMMTQAQEDLEVAKAGLGSLGQFGVDMASNIIQMGVDAGVGAATGGGTLWSMFLRSAGNASQEARQSGADIWDQVKYGTVKGAIEAATEKMFNGVAGIYGKGEFDDVTEALIKNLAETDTGRTVLRAIAKAAEEGSEEVVSDLLAPLAETIINDETLYSLFFDENGHPLKGSYSVNAAEILHSFLLGGAVGGLGGAADIALGRDARANAALRESEAEVPAAETAPTEAEPLAPDAALAEAATPTEVAGIPAPDTSAEVTPLMETLAEARGETPAVPVGETRMSDIERAEAAGPEVAAQAAELRDGAAGLRASADALEAAAETSPAIADMRRSFLDQASRMEEEAARLESEAATVPANPLADTLAEAAETTPAAEEAAEGISVPPQGAEADTEPVNEFNTDTATESATETAAETETPATATPKDAADRLLSDTGSTSKSSAVGAALQEIADYIQSNNNGEGIDEAELRSKAEAVAADIIDNIPGEETGDAATYEAVKDLLGKRGIEISDELRGDVADYNAWRKSLFGKLNLVKNGEAIDSIYSELSTAFPGLFPADVTSHADQISRIVDVLDGTKPGTSTWADTATQEDYDAALAEMTQKVLDEAGALPSGASAFDAESLASLEGEEPPVMLDGTPAVESTVTPAGREKISSFAKNVANSETTEDALKKALGDDLPTYRRLVSDDVMKAALDIYGRGFESAKSWLDGAIANAKANQELPFEAIPLARMIANEMTRNGDVVGADKLITDVSLKLTKYGQITNLGKLLRQSVKTSEGKLYGIQKVVDAINEEAGDAFHIELPKELIDEFTAAESDSARDDAISNMQAYIAKNTPTTVAELWNALRYTAMLGNFKTQAKNIFGNTGMQLNRIAKDRIAAGIEGIVYAMSGGEFERTKAAWAGTDLYGAAWSDFANVADQALGGGKYSDYLKQFDKEIQDKRRIIKLPGTWGTEQAATERGKSKAAKITRGVIDTALWVPEGARIGTQWLMDEGDQIFNHFAYADALAGWLKAHNITAEQWAEMINDPFKGETVDRARAYALKEAMESTFRDRNAVSDWAANIGNNGKNDWFSKLMRVLSHGLLAFRRTPANVGVRGFEYSPLGIIPSEIKTGQALKGEIPLSEAINQWSKTLTGTGIMALGWWLGAKGLLRLKNKDDDKQEQFDKLHGMQDYSLQIGDTSMTLDWVNPDNIPLFMGAMLAQESGENGLAPNAVEAANAVMTLFSAMFDPLLEESMISGINEALEVIRNDRTSDFPVLTLALYALASYFSQVGPSIAGQAERYSDEYRQTYYTDPNSAVPRAIQPLLSKFSNKIPGWDYQTMDYIDAWGRKQETDRSAGGALEQFATPWYTSEISIEPFEEEIQRLVDGAASDDAAYIRPEPATWQAGGNVGRLQNPEEYELFNVTNGQARYELVKDFIESEEYKDLDDAQRAEIIRNLYTLAKDKARTAVMRQRDEDWTGSDPITALLEAGMDTGEAASYILDVSGGDGKLSQKDLKEYYAEHPDEADTIGALWDTMGFTGKDTATWEAYTSSGGGAKSPKETAALTEGGMSQEDADALFSAIDSINSEDGTGNGRLTQKEIKAYYEAHKDDEDVETYLRALWGAMNWSKTFDGYVLGSK